MLKLASLFSFQDAKIRWREFAYIAFAVGSLFSKIYTGYLFVSFIHYFCVFRHLISLNEENISAEDLYKGLKAKGVINVTLAEVKAAHKNNEISAKRIIEEIRVSFEGKWH